MFINVSVSQIQRLYKSQFAAHLHVSVRKQTNEHIVINVHIATMYA